jgi:hypothetical protein
MIEASKYASFLKMIVAKCKANGVSKPRLTEEQYGASLKIASEIETLVKDLCKKTV